MTISNNYAPLRQQGNGVTTQFSDNWAMLAASYAAVFLEDASTGVQTPVTQGPGANQYTLTFNSSGFTVTFNTAPTSANYVVVSRNVAIDQTNPYRTSKGFQGEVEEDSFDKLTAICQDTRSIADRAITVPLGDTTVTQLSPATQRANKLLAFDALGNVVELATNDAGVDTVTATGTNTAHTLADRFNIIFEVDDYWILGETDWAPAWQRAHDAAAVYGGYIGLNPKSPNTMKSSVVHNPALVGVYGRGAKIDTTAITTTYFIRFNHTTGPRYGHSYHAWYDLFFQGPGYATSTTLFDYDTSVADNSSRVTMYNVKGDGYGVIHEYKNRAYLCKYFGCDWSGFNTAFSMQAGYTDYGEQIFLVDNIIGNGQRAFSLYNGNADITMMGGSIDYSTSWFDVGHGQLTFDNVHCEFDGSILTSPPMMLQPNTDATFAMKGGKILLTNGLNFTGFNDIIVATGSGGAWFDNVFMHNLALSSGRFGTGDGKIFITRTRTYSIAQLSPMVSSITDTNNNLVGNASFAGNSGAGAITDLVWITADTAAITSRFTGTNISLAASTDASPSGVNSLKATKAGNNFSLADYALAVPVTPGQRICSRFYYKKPGAQTGTVNIARMWYQLLGNDASGVPIIGRSQTVSSIALTLTSAAIDWTAANAPPNQDIIAPAWATHYGLQINLNAMNAGTFLTSDYVIGSI